MFWTLCLLPIAYCYWLLVGVSEAICNYVRTHLQCRLSFFFRIVMYARIFPAVAQVGLIGIEYHEASFIDQAQSLGWLSIVFMNFRYPIGEVELLMVDRMIERDLHQLKLRKDLF